MEEFKTKPLDQNILLKLELQIFRMEKENLKTKEASEDKMAEKIKKAIEELVRAEGKL